MKKYLLIISLILIGLSVKAQDGEFHVRIHGQENKGVILDTPVSSIDSMYMNPDAVNPFKVRTPNGLYSFDFTEIDSLTFPFVPVSTGNTIYVNYSGTSAEVTSPYPATQVIVTVSEAKVSITSLVSDNITYILSGTANPGRFEVVSEVSPIVKLNGVNLTNPTGKAMDLSCAAGIIMELVDGTQNYISDGENSDKKAAFMSNDDLLVQGNGTLTVTGLKEHAMKVKGQFNMNSGNIVITGSVKDGIHTEGLLVQGGNIDVQSCGDDGLTSELDGYINGGFITITSPTDSINGISADSTLVINGGNINITMSGVSANCIKADKELTINGGTFVLNNSGNVSKGIKSNSTITITDGDINITSSGGTVITNYDPTYCTGIKGDTDIIISGGNIDINLPSSNNGGKGISCEGNMTISGDNTIHIETHGDGSTYTASSGTDTYSSSCLRAEGNMQILEGNITLNSTGKAGKGIKVGKKNGNTYTGTYTQGNADGSGPTLTITTSGAQIGSGGGGGPWGGGGSGGTVTNPAQGYKFYTSSYTFQTGKYYTLSNTSGTGGTNMVTFSFESNCSSSLALITATGMVSGSTYYVKYGTEAPTGATTEFHGLYLGGTSSASTQAFSFTAQ